MLERNFDGSPINHYDQIVTMIEFYRENKFIDLMIKAIDCINFYYRNDKIDIEQREKLMRMLFNL